MLNETVMAEPKDLAARLKFSMHKLLAELESQVEEAQRILSRAADAEDTEAEFDSRIYMDAIEGFQDAVQHAYHYCKYLLGNIDAAGRLKLNEWDKFYLPAVGERRDTFEFSCGCGIEIFDEQRQMWLYGSVEYADRYEHGYYFKPAGIALQPGIKARHRYINPWND